MAENSYSIPVYRGWPERPYAVLGSLRFEDAHKAWDEGIFRMAASEAKSKGGDAVRIRDNPLGRAREHASHQIEREG